MLNLPKTTFESLKVLLTEHKDVAFRYCVSQIRKGVRRNEDRVKLFKFEGDAYQAVIDKDKYEKLVNDAMNYFVQEEMYEDAAKCRDVLKEIEESKDKKVVEMFLNEERNGSDA